MNKKTVNIPINEIILEGILSIPENAKGIIIFVHGSGSSRLSPRNNFVARELQKAGFATLLFDLLTEQEDENYENRFNISLLVDRLKKVTDWVAQQKEIKALPIGYFGASTGSASAIIAAADLESKIKAIVSRGGRPDLAGSALKRLTTPVLLIVGGDDYEVIELNREASLQIKTEKSIQIVPGATHLFSEPGALEEVARMAAEWFKKYLK